MAHIIEDFAAPGTFCVMADVLSDGRVMVEVIGAWIQGSETYPEFEEIRDNLPKENPFAGFATAKDAEIALNALIAVARRLQADNN